MNRPTSYVSALFAALLAAGCAEESALPLWIVEVDVFPVDAGEGALECGISVGDTDVEPKCGDAAQAKCMSWETRNPLEGGAVVADQDVTVGAVVVATGDDVATALFGDSFPRELYTYDEHDLAFAADASLADGTTLTFSWTDEEGTAYTDTLGYAGGALTE